MKKEIKTAEDKLVEHTIEAIENLTDSQVEMLLHEKWIRVLEDKLFAMPGNIVTELVDKVKSLSEKYAVTYAHIEEEITEVETSFSEMLDALTGSEYDMKGLEELKKLLGGM